MLCLSVSTHKILLPVLFLLFARFYVLKVLAAQFSSDVKEINARGALLFHTTTSILL